MAGLSKARPKGFTPAAAVTPSQTNVERNNSTAHAQFGIILAIQAVLASVEGGVLSTCTGMQQICCWPFFVQQHNLPGPGLNMLEHS